jgi:hypothetical protein
MKTFQLLGLIYFSSKTFTEAPKIQTGRKSSDYDTTSIIRNLAFKERNKQNLNDSNSVNDNDTKTEQMLKNSNSVNENVTKTEINKQLLNDSNTIDNILAKTEQLLNHPNSNSTRLTNYEINKQFTTDSESISQNWTEDKSDQELFNDVKSISEGNENTNLDDISIKIKLGSKAYYALEAVQNKLKNQVYKL